MKKFWLALGLAVAAHTASADNVKISELPLGDASTASFNDVFPYVDSVTVTTKKMRLFDLINLPAFTSTYAPLTAPVFTDGIFLKDSGSGLSINLVAPSLSTPYAFCLPVGPGTNGQVLTSNGTCTEWGTGAGGIAIGDSISGGFAFRLLYSDGSTELNQLAVGSAGQFLQSNGPGLAASWAAPPASMAIGTVITGATPWYSLYVDGSSQLAQTAPGTSGYVWTSTGPSSAPSWQPASGGVSSVNGQTGVVSLDLGDLGDVDFSTPPATNDVLTFDGTDWIASAAAASGANTALSNLTTTSINQELLPDLTLDKNLGSNALKWSNLYVGAVTSNAALEMYSTGGAVAVYSDTSSAQLQGATEVILEAPTIRVEGQVDMQAHKITDMADPTLAQDAATKNYVDTATAVTNSTFTGTTITGTATRTQKFRYTGGSAQTLATFTISSIPDGAVLRVTGSSDSNTITIPQGLTNVQMNGSWTGYQGSVITFVKDDTQLVEDSRNGI